MQVPFAQVLGRFAQKKAPGELPLLGGLCIYCIFLAKFMLYLFCGLARPFYWEGGEHHESIFISYPVRRSKHNLTLCLQVA